MPVHACCSSAPSLLIHRFLGGVAVRGGVTGRPEFIPPYWYFAFFSDGFRIWGQQQNQGLMWRTSTSTLYHIKRYRNNCTEDHFCHIRTKNHAFVNRNYDISWNWHTKSWDEKSKLITCWKLKLWLLISTFYSHNFNFLLS